MVNLVGVVSSDILQSKQTFRLTMQQETAWYRPDPSFQTTMDDVINRMASTQLVMPLMPNPTLAQQTTATIIVRVLTNGIGKTVGQMVDALNNLSSFASVREVEYLSGRVGLASSDPKANADKQAKAEIQKAKEDKAASPLTTAADAGKKILTTLEFVAVAAVVIALVFGINKVKGK